MHLNRVNLHTFPKEMVTYCTYHFLHKVLQGGASVSKVSPYHPHSIAATSVLPPIRLMVMEDGSLRMTNVSETEGSTPAWRWALSVPRAASSCWCRQVFYWTQIPLLFKQKVQTMGRGWGGS